MTVLAREIATYLARAPRMILAGRFGFLLVRGERVFGCFDDEVEAVKEGWKRFGRKDFLVRELSKEKLGDAVLLLALQSPSSKIALETRSGYSRPSEGRKPRLGGAKGR